MTDDARSARIRERVAHEVRTFIGLSLYLFLCLGAFLLYKSALLRDEGIAFAPFGIAAVKALILAKFLMLGEAVRAGRRFRPKPLLGAVLHRSVALFLVLLALTLVEEWLIGVFHGHTLAQTLGEMLDGRWREVVSGCVLVLLALMPYVGMQEVREALGEDEWRRLLRGRK